MRALTTLIATLTCAPLTLSACGRDEARHVARSGSGEAPSPTPVEPAPSIGTPARPPAERPYETLPEPVVAPVLSGPADRTEAIQSSLRLVARGEVDEAFKYFAPDVVWSDVGVRGQLIESLPEVVAYVRKAYRGFSDMRLEPRRILETGEHQVVEYVWQGRHTGTLADGSLATGRTATLPGAMLLHYGDTGLVDRVWVYQDWPSALQQLGLAPGLPDDFQAASLGAEPEVVIGPANDDYRALYLALRTRSGPADLAATLAARVDDDVALANPLNGQLIQGRDAVARYFAKSATVLEPEATEITNALSAGPYLVAVVTHTHRYKGGFMGIPAEGQRVTTHTLDVVRFDPDTLKITALACYGSSYELMGELAQPAGSASRP